MYTVTIDREACDGVFACLVRDDRFREDGDGLADLDAEAVETVERTAERVRATLSEDRESAEQAARACPLDAITVADGPPGEAAAHADTDAEDDP